MDRFLQIADKYSDLRELDAAVVSELIEKIVIHSPEKIGETFATPVPPEFEFTCL